MSDDKGQGGRGGKTLGLRGGTEKSHVRQSFSHGRSKSVVVETKRKRVIVPKTGAGAGGKGGKGGSASDAEMERRRRALQAAQATESDRLAKAQAEEKRREEERQRLREEKEREEREAIEAAEAKKRAEEEAAAKKKAEEEAAKAGTVPAEKNRQTIRPPLRPHRRKAATPRARRAPVATIADRLVARARTTATKIPANLPARVVAMTVAAPAS